MQGLNWIRSVDYFGQRLMYGKNPVIGSVAGITTVNTVLGGLDSPSLEESRKDFWNKYSLRQVMT